MVCSIYLFGTHKKIDSNILPLDEFWQKEQSTKECQTWPEVRLRMQELRPLIYFCFLLP